MLRRLGLRAGENEHINHAQQSNSSDSAERRPTREHSSMRAVRAPPVDYHRQTRYVKVIYRGEVAVRPSPMEPAPEDGQSFGFGDVIEVSGLAVAVPEGVVVEVKRPQGGWVFQRHGDRTLLEEVDALKVEEGDWWYRVVHPAGAHFVKIPSLLPKASRSSKAVPQNTVVHACRRHTPPGSSVSFVELVDSMGWIVESAKDGKVLERMGDGEVVVENITGEYRDESEAWYRVVAEPGVELLRGPDEDGARMLEMFLPEKVFCVSQRFRPPARDESHDGYRVYLKIKDREAWVLQSRDGEQERCVQLPPPMDELVEQWYRVEYPGGVRLRASPSFEHTHPSLGVLVCGWVFLATRRYRAPGSSHLFLQVATPEGVVREVAVKDKYGERQQLNGAADNHKEGEGDVGGERRESGWVPTSSNGIEVVAETIEPWIEKGLFAYQVVVDETLPAKTGPHELAPGVLQHLPPYSVAAVATFLETGSGNEGFVQLAGTGSWVLARRGEITKMARLPAFPDIDKTPRRFVVSASGGVETIVGPSAAAPRTGHVLPAGTEGRSEMVWSVKGWPGDRGKGSTRFVLLEDMGWIHLQGNVGGGGSGHGGMEQDGEADDVLTELDAPEGERELFRARNVEESEGSVASSA